MGTQRHIGVGYGVHLPNNVVEDIEDDLWDAVEDDYHLLQVSLCGNYWNNPEGMVIVVKSTFTEKDDFYTPEPLKATGGALADEAGLEQLSQFINTYYPEGQPDWMVWSYEG